MPGRLGGIKVRALGKSDGVGNFATTLVDHGLSQPGLFRGVIRRRRFVGTTHGGEVHWLGGAGVGSSYEERLVTWKRYVDDSCCCRGAVFLSLGGAEV